MGAQRRSFTWAGAILVVLGLLGHLLSAHAIAGVHTTTYIAYRDHIVGYFLIAAVTGAIIAALGWRFWKARTDITVLVFGIVQALFGLFVYINRFNV